MCICCRVACPLILPRGEEKLRNHLGKRRNLKENHSEGGIHLLWTDRLDWPVGDMSPSVDGLNPQGTVTLPAPSLRIRTYFFFTVYLIISLVYRDRTLLNLLDYDKLRCYTKWMFSP